jgi:HAD superfamily hydrolase (TIGR01509 family)
MTSPIQLVIFDCDGVLVDSEPIAETVLAAVLGELGVPLARADVRRTFFGKTTEQCIGIIEGLTGRAMSEELIVAWRERLYTAFRETPVRAVDGVHDVLETLRSQLRLPVCVVSNGPIAKMETTLGVAGLRHHFASTLFSPDLGMPGKPAPDLFLAAARDFHVAPRHCAVIEDSAGGVRGAVTAGMRSFGFTGLPLTDAVQLAAAGAELFDNMRSLPGLLVRG